MAPRPIQFFTVTAPEGRECPLHPSDLTDAGASAMTVRPGDVVAVPDTSNIRRRVAAGDLVYVDGDGRRVSSVDKARTTFRGIVHRAEIEADTVDLDPPPLTAAPARGKTESVTPRFDTTDAKER